MSSNSSRLRRVVLAIGLLAWVFLGFMLAQGIVILLITILDANGITEDTLGNTLYYAATTVLVYSLVLLIIIGVPWKLRKRGVSWADIGLGRGPKLTDFAWPIAGAVGYIIIASIITVAARYIFPDADYDQPQEIGFEALSYQWEYVVVFVSLVIIAPFAEEIMFRGYLLGKLTKYIPVWLAIVLTAALFALAHGQFNIALDTFALGIVLGILRVSSGSLWPSIFLHMLKNGVAFYFLFVNPFFL